VEATLRAALFVLLASSTLFGKTTVFWQDGFPSVESAPVTRQTLEQALPGDQATFANIDALRDPAALNSSDLLVLPYGSAFPAEAWPGILAFVQHGGNLLVLGGQALRVPVTRTDGKFVEAPAEDAYSRELGILHTYRVPQQDGKTFAWKPGYTFLPALQVQSSRFFVLEGRGIDGLGYMLNPVGDKVAAPVVVSNHTQPNAGEMLGARWVFLDFQPNAGYWDSPDGLSLIRTAANYAVAGATSFWLETPYATLKPSESPQVVVHLRDALKQKRGLSQSGEVSVQLLSGDRVLGTLQAPCNGRTVDLSVDFQKAALTPGFYTIRGTYLRDGKPREFYQNGFWVEDEKLLKSGPVLGVHGDFLTKDHAPFFPFGTNYFTTEENGWDFSGPRNADVWERDFEEMEKHGVSFVRTGVWGGLIKFLDGAEGGVPERFLRNLEAYLLSARRHHIAVNFTFFAFDPQTTLRLGGEVPVTSLAGSNPYLDPVTIRAEQNYMLSILERFKDVPYLCWDLINEPSFSSPRHLWRGNTPNEDAAELRAWRQWLREKYTEPGKLAAAWSVASNQIASFDAVPLPGQRDLNFNLEAGHAGQERASDYNLFAQDMFSGWVKTMVAAIGSTGSTQLIDVGQDEGGVTGRVLNQFYGTAGVSFTTNHTYRQNHALLWDSLAAKVPGIPNIVGETGYQPVILPNGDWHFDELTGASLIERKWASGFADGTSGALSWDWAREIYFGIKRSDGSNKIWEDTMRDMGAFVKKAETYATGLIAPEVAIVLPQSLQLSVFNHVAVEAQQNSIRALYGYARSQAYAVGEDQVALLGNPKLIIVPSPWVLNEATWTAIIQKVNDGATLLISGRFDEDPHFHVTDRPSRIGIPYLPGQLFTQVNEMEWPGGKAELIYSGEKTNFLERAVLPEGKTFVEKTVGKGKILFAALPLELNENLEAVGEIYSYALKAAGVKPVYSTDLKNSGMLICPTQFPHATLYVLTSETGQREISFRDERSGKQFSGQLEPGRAALVLAGEDGSLLASYNWK
jgi:Beta-galactosidase